MGDIFGDVFGDIFGGSRSGRSGPARGSDLRYELELSLEKAVSGQTMEIDVPVLDKCRACDGSGAKKGTSPQHARTAMAQDRLGFSGILLSTADLSTMSRTGQIITDPCPACGGAGRVRRDKTLSVKIPAGVDTGDRIRLSGEGRRVQMGAQQGIYTFKSKWSTIRSSLERKTPVLRSAYFNCRCGSWWGDRSAHLGRTCKFKNTV